MKELVKKAMHGDTQAFVTVIQECTESMYRVARSFLRDDEDIADVLQTTIMVCFEKIDTLRNPNYFKTWMIRILINECKDMLMRQKNIQLTESLEDILDRDRQFCQSQIEEDFETKELLNLLDEKYRTIMILYYLEGFKVSEIGKLLDMKVSTVKTRLSRGRQELQRLYKESEGDGRYISQSENVVDFVSHSKKKIKEELGKQKKKIEMEVSGRYAK